MSKKLVIIPTYNERENIRSIIYSVLELSVGFDLLIIDDNSPDATAAIVKDIILEHGGDNIHLIERSGKLGLGTAYLEGFEWALAKQYDYVFEMDADFSHNPKDLILLLDVCEKEKYDLSIGSRYIKGVNVVNWPIGRVLISYFASIYVRFITGMPIKDATAGFVCYSSNMLRQIALEKIRFMGYGFQIEMKFNIWKHGFKIKEVPIIFTDRTKGISKMNRRIFKEAVFGIIEMKVRSLFIKYPPPM